MILHPLQALREGSDEEKVRCALTMEPYIRRIKEAYAVSKNIQQVSHLHKLGAKRRKYTRDREENNRGNDLSLERERGVQLPCIYEGNRPSGTYNQPLISRYCTLPHLLWRSALSP